MKILNVTYNNPQFNYIKKIIKEEINYYNDPFNIKNIINEEINSLFESKKTEELAVNALTKNNIADIDNLLNQFKEIDKTKNQMLLPGLAKAYIEHPQINDLRGVFNFIGENLNNKKIKQFIASKKGYMIDDKRFNNWLELSEYIHQQQQLGQTDEDTTDVEVEGAKPIWENDKISIYDGRDKNKCINYGEGGISGKKYQFCIGTRGSGMHQSYRDTKTSTFWYVFDKTKDMSDPLHLVVVDAVDPSYAQQRSYNAPYELTDDDNSTGNISQFGSDVKGYIDYLKSQGVPVDEVLKHDPHSEEEKITLELLKQKNPNLDWFKNIGALAQEKGFALDQDVNKLTYKLQSQYIGRGHQLSDDQFMYLWPHKKQPAAYNLLKQLVNTGMPLPESQFNILVGNNNG